MDYIEKFKNRINGYMYASSKYNKVLENENKIAVEMLNPMENEKILHIAAAGVNIKQYIIPHVDLIEVDQNEDFAKIGNIDCIDLNNMPYDDNTFDKVIVIANFHHSTNQEREVIYKEVYRVLKPTGTFVLGDVLKGSQQDGFLNGFVDKYNPYGHYGIFFDNTDINLFESTGFETTIHYNKYTWNFESMDCLIDFCYNFFHLLNIEKDKIYEEIKKYLTITPTTPTTLTNTDIKWDWELVYFVSKSKKAQ